MHKDIAELYVDLIAKIAEGHGLKMAVQKAMPVAADKKGILFAGALYLMPSNTTRPEMSIAFSFQTDQVMLQTRARNEQNTRTGRGRTIAYAEGLDSWAMDLDKDLKAGRLAAPKHG